MSFDQQERKSGQNMLILFDLVRSQAGSFQCVNIEPSDEPCRHDETAQKRSLFVRIIFFVLVCRLLRTLPFHFFLILSNQFWRYPLNF